MMTLPPIQPTKSPAEPGSRTIGAKASVVVTVEARSGRNRSPWLSATASSAPRPSRSERVTWSVMTIALSTRRPIAMIMPKIVIWWSAPPLSMMT